MPKAKSKPGAKNKTAQIAERFGIEEARTIAGLATTAWLRLRTIHRQQVDIAARIEIDEIFPPDSVPGVADLKEIAELRDSLTRMGFQDQANHGKIAANFEPPLDQKAVECLGKLHGSSSAICKNLVREGHDGLLPILPGDVGHFEHAVRQLRSAIPARTVAEQGRWTVGDLLRNLVEGWREFANTRRAEGEPPIRRLKAFGRHIDLDTIPGIDRIRHYASKLDLPESRPAEVDIDPVIVNAHIVGPNLEARLLRSLRARDGWANEITLESLPVAEVADLIDSAEDLVCPQCKKFMGDKFADSWACEACHREKNELHDASMAPLRVALECARLYGNLDLNTFEGLDWPKFRAEGRELFGDEKFDANPWTTLRDWAYQANDCEEWHFLLVPRAEVLEHLKAACEEKDRGQASPSQPIPPVDQPSDWDRIVVDIPTKTVTFDGNAFTINDPPVFNCLSKLIIMRGNVVTNKDLESLPGCGSKRFDQVFDKLPKRIRDLIESRRGNGGGYWITLPRSTGKPARGTRKTPRKNDAQ